MARMLNQPHPLPVPRVVLHPLSRWIVASLLLVPCAQVSAQDFVVAQSSSSLPCPDLGVLMPGNGTDWHALLGQLEPLLPRCLRNSQYFALLGAAQMNTGRLSEALESLERSLLIEPRNGGAQVDYAEALFRQGQLFSALELNQQILHRDDVPDYLSNMLTERQNAWQSLTRQWAYQADLLTGYDSNLNGAPYSSQITLTLSGENVVLPLNPDFQAMEGPYLNMRLGARYRQLAPDHQHNVLLEMRGRVSEDKSSDLLQLDTRYAFISPGQQNSWQLTTGMSHLFFGGSPLYTATEAGGQYQFTNTFTFSEGSSCRPFASAAAQHQLFHDQSTLNALESKVGSGLNCQLETAWGRQLLVPTLSALYNNSLRGGDQTRAGGSRSGWQANLDWHVELPGAILTTQLSHTRMVDRQGYSPLLADGAKRWVQRSYALVQYRRPLASDINLMLNLYHQEQRSNLELFRSRDSSVEVGININF